MGSLLGSRRGVWSQVVRSASTKLSLVWYDLAQVLKQSSNNNKGLRDERTRKQVRNFLPAPLSLPNKCGLRKHMDVFWILHILCVVSIVNGCRNRRQRRERIHSDCSLILRAAARPVRGDTETETRERYARENLNADRRVERHVGHARVGDALVLSVLIEAGCACFRVEQYT